jgi:uncharacterized repeat protein (TIGR02543 family)
LNFKNNDEFKKWKTTYSAHSLTFPEGTVFFDSAVRQTKTITNMPVTKGEPVSFVLNEGLVLTGIKLTCKQWTTKTQTITLHYSTDGGDTYTATEQTSSNFSLECTSLPTGTRAVKFTFGNTNQIGIESLTITYSQDTDTRKVIQLTDFSAPTTKLFQGDSTRTLVSNDQPDWKASYLYSSSNQAVATIDERGVITAVGKGEAILTVKANVAADDPNYRLGRASSKTLNVVVRNPLHRVSFSVNGVIQSFQVEEGENINLPAPDATLIPTGWTFMGWTTEALDGRQPLPPAIVKSAVMANEDVLFYAVWATATVDASSNWHQVTIDEVVSITEPDTFAIVNTQGYAFNGVIVISKKVATVGDGQMTETTFSFDEQGRAAGAPAGTCLLVFSPKQGTQGIEIKRASDGKILYAKTYTSGNLSWTDSTNGFWMKDDKTGLLVYSGTALVTYLRDNNNNLLRTYSGAGYGSDIAFVRKGQAVSYSDYCTLVHTEVQPLRTVVTIADCGYTTVCLSYNAVVDPEAQLYSLRKIDQAGLHFSPTDTLQAQQGYVLQGSAGATYSLTEVTEPCLDTLNLLCGVVEATFCQDLDLQGQGDYAYPWILAKDGQFKRYVGESIPAGKAYLDGALLENLSINSNSAPLRVLFDSSDDDQSTALDTLNDKTLTTPCYYNLQGKRISRPTQKTLLIDCRGRKIAICK